MKPTVQMLEGQQSVLDHLGNWRMPLEAVLEVSTVISEVRRYIDSKYSRPDAIKLHPAAKAALSCVNILYKVCLSLPWSRTAVTSTVGRNSKIKTNTSSKYVTWSRRWTKYVVTSATSNSLLASWSWRRPSRKPGIWWRKQKTLFFFGRRRGKQVYVFHNDFLPRTHFLHTANFLINDSDAKDKLEGLTQRYGMVLEQFRTGVAIDTLGNTNLLLDRQGG